MKIFTNLPKNITGFKINIRGFLKTILQLLLMCSFMLYQFPQTFVKYQELGFGFSLCQNQDQYSMLQVTVGGYNDKMGVGTMKHKFIPITLAKRPVMASMLGFYMQKIRKVLILGFLTILVVVYGLSACQTFVTVRIVWEPAPFPFTVLGLTAPKIHIYHIFLGANAFLGPAFRIECSSRTRFV